MGVALPYQGVKGGLGIAVWCEKILYYSQVIVIRWDNNITSVYKVLYWSLVASLKPLLRFAQLGLQNEATRAQ